MQETEGKYLVINAGSSSLKFSLYTPEGEEAVNGCVEKIGSPDSFYTLKFDNQKLTEEFPVNDHISGVLMVLLNLVDMGLISNLGEIRGVGHRVLHGGEKYSDSVLIDEEVVQSIKDLTKLGPLHHPGNLAGIEAMKKVLGGVPQVAVFDTAFHQTMPEENYMYPVPYEWYEENGVRKYGFHGTSIKYVTKQMKEVLGKEEPNLIVCHVGSGASITAVKDGKSFNTTMGLTPLDGLMMGTRSGSIDSSIIEYICHERGMTVEEVTKALNKESGLKGITGVNDLRDVQELAANGDKKAELAIQLFEKSIVNSIAQYYFQLDADVDAIVFTAGVGENAIEVRRDVMHMISKPLGITLDEEKNETIAGYKDINKGIITTEDSNIPVFVVPTNEEKMILEDTIAITKEAEKAKKLVKE